MYKISICVSAYNRVDYLKETLNTLTTQIFNQDYEVVVVDDGSSENIQSMIKTEFPSVKYFYKENGGDASAKNFAVKMSQGEYIVFCDSDDLFLPNSLQLLYDEMIKHEKGAIIYSQSIPIDSYGNIKENKRKKNLRNYPSGNILEALIKDVIVYSGGVLFPRDLFLNTEGYIEGWKFAFDYKKALEWTINNNFYPVATETYKRRRHNSNISNDCYEGCKVTLYMMEDFGKNNPNLSNRIKKCIKKRLSNYHIKLAREAKKENLGFELVKYHLKESLKLNFNLKAFFRFLFI